MRLDIGIADVVSKLIAYRLIAPALALPDRCACREDRPPAGRARRCELDLVLSDAPPPNVHVKAVHLLGECGVTFFATPCWRRRSAAIPRLADGRAAAPADRGHPAPPPDRRLAAAAGPDAGRRRRVRGQRTDEGVRRERRRRIRGAIRHQPEVRRRYGVVNGTVESIRERISAIRWSGVKHPAVAAIAERARADAGWHSAVEVRSQSSEKSVGVRSQSESVVSRSWSSVGIGRQSELVVSSTRSSVEGRTPDAEGRKGVVIVPVVV